MYDRTRLRLHPEILLPGVVERAPPGNRQPYNQFDLLDMSTMDRAHVSAPPSPSQKKAAWKEVNDVTSPNLCFPSPCTLVQSGLTRARLKGSTHLLHVESRPHRQFGRYHQCDYLIAWYDRGYVCRLQRPEQSRHHISGNRPDVGRAFWE